MGEEVTTIKGKTVNIGRDDLTGSTNTIQAGTTLLRQVEDVFGSPTITDVLRVSTSAGFRVTDDKIVSIASNYFAVRNAADSGDVFKINNAGVTSVGTIATGAGVYMSANEFTVVPTDAFIIGNDDDTSNRIVLNNTQHGSETLFIDIGNNTRIRTPLAEVHAETTVLNATYTYVKQNDSTVMFISRDDGTIFTDDKFKIVPTTSFYVRNKDDDAHIIAAETSSKNSEKIRMRANDIHIGRGDQVNSFNRIDGGITVI